MDAGAQASLPLGLAFGVPFEGSGDLEAATLARTAVVSAAAAQGAAVIITRRSAAGAALRGARELGVEPRVSLPAPSVSLSARTPLTLALQGPRSSPAFASTASFVAGFVGGQAAAPGAPPDAALSLKLLQAIAKARDASKTVVDFAAVAAWAAKALGPAHPARSEVAKALGALDAAEACARLFGAPAPWEALLAPSPTGRRAAVFVDLGTLPPADGQRVEALGLAALAVSLDPGAGAPASGPVFVVADAPEHPLGAYACQRLASGGEGHSPKVLALLAPRAAGSPSAAFPQAQWGEGTLRLPGREAPLSLSPPPEPLLPLSDDEVVALTPPTLRARLVGGASDEDEGALRPGAPTAASAAAAENQRALDEATAALEAIARRRTKPGAAPASKRPRDYEASDFEL